jgi:hypothetical protein
MTTSKTHTVYVEKTTYTAKTDTALKGEIMEAAVEIFCLDGQFNKLNIKPSIKSFTAVGGKDETGYYTKVYATVILEEVLMEIDEDVLEDMYEWFLEQKFAA